jgi:glycosyltransferase involved in cell wall biosynthesis
MDNYKISIIIPIYRTEDYLRDCLESVRNQTYPYFEALLVNDATPDQAMDIAREFAKEDERFRVIEHEENRGPGASRNTGIDDAKSDYLFFLDSDDQLPEDALETLIKLASENNADMVVGNMAWWDGRHQKKVDYIDNRFDRWKKYAYDNLRKLPPKTYALGSACHKLISRELVLNNDILFSSGVYWEDIIFSMETWMFSEIIIGLEKVVYLRTEREDPDNPSIRQKYNQKIIKDRNSIANQVFQSSLSAHDRVSDSYAFGIFTLRKIRDLSKRLIRMLPANQQLLLGTTWYPFHFCKITFYRLILFSLTISHPIRYLFHSFI